ncbi:MAG: type II secretion system protein [Phycisphaerales bacterium]|nr:type II secretion system GspH family protein [bacterium]
MIDRPNQRSGFTLVEILIVVVILGILASIVVPQFVSATTEATKTHIQRNLQEIANQVEVYKGNHAGGLPTSHPDEPLQAGSWGILVSADYLREEPRNFYTSSTEVGEGTYEEALALTSDAVVGWLFEVNGRALNFYAAGYDAVNDVLSNETVP